MKMIQKLRLVLELIRVLKAIIGLIEAIIELLNMALNYSPDQCHA